MADINTDVLSGSSSDSPIFGTMPPMAPPGGASPNVPAPQDTATGAPPDIGTPPIVPSQTGPVATNTPPPAPPAGQPSVWKDVVMGALYGMSAGAQVRGHNAGAAALGAGVGGELQAQDRKQQLQFESVRAADSHIAALNQARAADNANEEAKLHIADLQQQAQEKAEELGLPAKITITGDNPNDLHAQASGALTTLANGNGGKIPAVTVTNSPATKDDPNHTIHVYSVNAQDVTSNPNGVLKIINQGRAYAGLPPITSQADLQVAGGAASPGNWRAGVAQMANKAFSDLFTVPLADKDAGKNQAQIANMQQQLDSYKAHKDANGQPDADPGVTKALQTRLDAFTSSAENTRKGTAASEAATVAEKAPAEANAAALKAGAEAKAKLPYELAKAKAEQVIKDGDPNAAGQLLANGDVAPSQIISARNPAFAQQAFDAAKKLSGGTWNAQAAEGWFKNASTPANVTFFGSAKSLTDKGGTLDQLASQYAKLPNGQLPSLNKIADWKSAAAGKGPMAGFAQTALGVADDYAKVMGGGTGSDTGREEVLQSFAASHSPEQMAAAIAAARGAVGSQINSRIGSNPVMKRMFAGDQAQASQQPIYAAAPGKPRMMSTDGGNTWQPAPAQ